MAKIDFSKEFFIRSIKYQANSIIDFFDLINAANFLLYDGNVIFLIQFQF